MPVLHCRHDWSWRVSHPNLTFSIPAIAHSYNNSYHSTIKYPPVWLMYGKPPDIGWEEFANFTPAKFRGDFRKDWNTALRRIKSRAEKLSVDVQNTNYVVGQVVLVQLCSRAEGAPPREWYSAAKIISLGPEKDTVRVRYENCNINRPEGWEQTVPVRLLYPLIDDLDIQASVEAGRTVSAPHPAINARDTRVYIDKILMSRKIKYGKNKVDETSYLVLYSGNTFLQASWVLDDRLDESQLSHVEELVCKRNRFCAVLTTAFRQSTRCGDQQADQC